MKPLYIFDLDGTLALIEHRRHYVTGGRNDWRAFFRACVRDVPNAPVIATLQALRAAGNEIWIWSGRSDEVRVETETWLKANVLADIGWLKMREAGDYTPDDELKQGWFGSMADIDKARLCAVFDDRDRVVKMWRDNGVPCFQVAPGEF